MYINSFIIKSEIVNKPIRTNNNYLSVVFFLGTSVIKPSKARNNAMNGVYTPRKYDGCVVNREPPKIVGKLSIA